MFYGSSQSKHVEGNQTVKAVTDAAATAKQDVIDAAQVVLRQAQEKLTMLAKQGEKTGKQVDTFVHEHSWTSVALAAGVGLIIGTFLSRGRR